MTRLNGVLRYMVSLMTSGLTWTAPGRAALALSVSAMAFSSVIQLQAGCSPITLLRFRSDSGEYFAAPGSPPYTAQSKAALGGASAMIRGAAVWITTPLFMTKDTRRSVVM